MTTPIPSRAVEYSSKGTSGLREYTLSPEELEEIRNKYPATKRDKDFKKPIVQNVLTKEDKEMAKFKMTADQYFAERQAGKSQEQIAEEQGVTPQAIDYHLKKWGSEGKRIEPDKTQLLQEKESRPQQPVSHDLVKEYKAQVEQLKSALDESLQENERLTTELVETKQMFDKAYQRNVNANAKIGEHLQAIQELREEVEHWREQADITGKTNTQVIAEHEALQDELNRLFTERDELVAENERLKQRMHEPQLADKPNDIQLLDRSIAELTRARKIINLLSASGE